MDEALRTHGELVQRHWGTVCPSSDNAFSALNGALWEGGTFVYVPEGVRVARPLRLRRRARGRGLYEHTLIVVGAGAAFAYEESLEGPVAGEDALHAGVMEVVVERGASCRVTTVRRWPGAVYHLVTKRALAHAGARMEWVDAGAGGRVTMTYPSVYLAGTGAHGAVHSVAVASDGEHQDTGGKLVVSAPGCRGRARAHLVARGTGRATYRGLVKVARGATAADCAVRYDTLLADPGARFDAHPYIEIDEADAAVAHDSAVTRGADDAAAVRRFLGPALRELPADAAVGLAALAGAAEPDESLERDREGDHA
jgi:Fe-S cluster assembly protein SufB